MLELEPDMPSATRPASPSGWRVPDGHFGTTLSNLAAPKILSPARVPVQGPPSPAPRNLGHQRWTTRGSTDDAEAVRFGVPIITALVQPNDSTAAVHRYVPTIRVRVRLDAEADVPLSQGRRPPGCRFVPVRDTLTEAHVRSALHQFGCFDDDFRTQLDVNETSPRARHSA